LPPPSHSFTTLDKDPMRIRAASRTMLTAVLVLVASAACGSDSTSPDTGNASVTGTYSLKSLAGVALPAPGKDQTGAVYGTVNTGTLTLTSTNTFASNLSYTPTAGGTGTKSDGGTYAVTGTTVNFRDSSGQDLYVATFSGGNTLTFTANGQVRVYQK